MGRISPDLILLDAMMPGMDGFETCRRLKQSPVAHVPVIFMTALSETEHIVAGLAAGGVDYVTKPIVLDELFARIRVHLANARAAESTRIALDRSGSSLVCPRRERRRAVVDAPGARAARRDARRRRDRTRACSTTSAGSDC